jgi:hypothetical protein
LKRQKRNKKLPSYLGYHLSTTENIEGPETTTIGGEWEPQISFKTFDRYPKIKP